MAGHMVFDDLRNGRAAACAERFQRKAHHDVGAGEAVIDQPGFALQCRRQCAHVALQRWADVQGVDLPVDGLGNGADEERRLGRDCAEQQLHHQQRHQRAFRVVHPVAMFQAGIGIAWRAQGAVAVLLDQVFDNGP